MDPQVQCLGKPILGSKYGAESEIRTNPNHPFLLFPQKATQQFLEAAGEVLCRVGSYEHRELITG